MQFSVKHKTFVLFDYCMVPWQLLKFQDSMDLQVMSMN